MSKEIQSAGVRADANCGAKAITKTPREDALLGVSAAIDDARWVLCGWLGEGALDGRANLEAEPVGDGFCDALHRLLERAERRLGRIAPDLARDHPLIRAWMLIGGARELLLRLAIAAELQPLGGVAILRLLDDIDGLLHDAAHLAAPAGTPADAGAVLQ